MIPGKPFTSNAITADDTYFYYADVDLGRFGFYGKGNNRIVNQANHREHLFISVVDKTKVGHEIPSQIYGPNEDSIIKHIQGINLPFRHPMMYNYGEIDLSSDERFLAFNPNVSNLTFVRTNGYMKEFTLDKTTKLKLDDQIRVYYNKRGNYTENVIASSKNESHKSNGILQYMTKIDYYDHYPTNISMYAVKEGGKRYLYISYVYSYRCINQDPYFFWGENHFGNFGQSSLPLSEFDYSVNLNRTLNSVTRNYIDRTFDYRINIPMIVKYEYDDGNDTITYDSISYPFADNTRLVDPDGGTESYNLRIMPYQTVQFGSVGSLELPSSNKCVANSYMDYDNNRLVNVAAYESPDENEFPTTYTLKVTYHSTSSSLSIIPAQSDSIPNIELLLRQQKQFNHITNINKIDITLWEDNYIVSISYDSKTGSNPAKHGTLIMKIDTTPLSPVISYFTNIKDAAFGGLQGISDGSMT